MKTFYTILLLTVLSCALPACHGSARTSQQQVTAAPQPAPAATDPENPHQEQNNQFTKKIFQEIAGREKEPAGQVFKNIKMEKLRTVPAGRFLRIMNRGYSRALGVTCTHCHVEQDFASDEKRPKRAAREMAVMHGMINEQLATMQNLEPQPEGRFINCSTCHHGKINPLD